MAVETFEELRGNKLSATLPSFEELRAGPQDTPDRSDEQEISGFTDEEIGQMQEMVNKANDPSDLRVRLQDALYYNKWLGIAPGEAFSFAPTIKKVAFDGKAPPKLTLLEDYKKAAEELPENLKIGTLSMAGGILSAIKREGMRWSGAGLFPDQDVRHAWELPKPQSQPRQRLEGPLSLLQPKGPLPGSLTAEAFAVTQRLPDLGTKIIERRQKQLIEKQDRVTLESAPITRLMRPLVQNVPQYGLAIGLGVLTGDPVVSLGVLGSTSGGQEFENQLAGGGSLGKSMMLADLNAAAEVGGEFLVLPKILKGFDEGLTIRQLFNIIGENATQEGATGFTQRFLEVVGLETSRGVDFTEAAKDGVFEGIKAIPENAWVGGALGGAAGGAGMITDALRDKHIGTETSQKQAAEKLTPDQTAEMVRQIKAGMITREQVRRAMASAETVQETQTEAERQAAEMEAQNQAHLRAIAAEGRNKGVLASEGTEGTEIVSTQKPTQVAEEGEVTGEIAEPDIAQEPRTSPPAAGQSQEGAVLEPAAEQQAGKQRAEGGRQKDVEIEDVTDEQLSGITKRRRNKLIRETQDAILADPMYQASVEAEDVRARQIDVGLYQIQPNFKGDVELALDSATAGWSAKDRRAVEKMFVFEPTENAMPWDVAVQQGFATSWENYQYDTSAHMDISEFVQRVAQAYRSPSKRRGRIDTATLEKAVAMGDPYTAILAEKLELLQRGFSDIQINQVILDAAERNDIAPENVTDLLVGGDKLKAVAEMPEGLDKEAEYLRLAAEQVLIEEQMEAQKAATEVLEANGIKEVPIEIVEEIGLPEKPDDGIPFERPAGRPTGAAMTRGQRQVIYLALGADIETGYHEGYHILRTRLTDDDLATLIEHFHADEEAEARAFAEWMAEKRGTKDEGRLTSAVRAVFEKLKAILEKVKTALFGKGLRTVEDIFGDIATGRIAKVEVVERSGMAFEMGLFGQPTSFGRRDIQRDFGWDMEKYLRKPRAVGQIKPELVRVVDKIIQRTLKPGSNDVQVTPEQVAMELVGRNELFNKPANIRFEVQSAFDEITKGRGLFEIRYEIKEPSDIFFSKLQRAVEQSMPNKMDAAAFKGWMAKQGIKADESKWTGIDELLSKNQTVTKQQVLDTIKANDVQLVEVLKAGHQQGEGADLHILNERYTHIAARQVVLEGDIIAAFDTLPINDRVKYTERLRASGGLLVAVRAAVGSDGANFNQSEVARKDLQRMIPNFDWDQVAIVASKYYDVQREIRREQSRIRESTETRYDQWKLPGGENYREVLVTLPITEASLPPGWKVEERQDKLQPRYPYYVVVDNNGLDRFGANDRMEAVRGALDSSVTPDRMYRSPHWSEKNVLSHIRLTDRTDKAGKRILFIEEIQSDWHQKGREEGYQGEVTNQPLSKEELQQVIDGMRESVSGRGPGYLSKGEIDTFERDIKSFQEGKIPFPFYLWDQPYNSRPRTGKAAELAGHLLAYENELYQQRSSAKVPQAPFSKTWHELMFKRVLRMAAEGDYDAMAWTTGEQQGERYPNQLRQFVDKVKWETLDKTEADTIRRLAGVGKAGQKAIFLSKNNMPVTALYVDAQTGRIANASGGYQEALEGNPLADVIGKEMARQVLGGERGEIPGVEFKIGAEGMKAFYDVILPSFAKQYTKKWGVSGVGETEIRERANKGTTPTQKAFEYVSVHSVPVTAAMKESVLAGQTKYELSNERARREVNRNAQIKARAERLKAMGENMPGRKSRKASRARLNIRLQDTTPPLRDDLTDPVDKAAKTQIPAAFITEEPPAGTKPPTRKLYDDAWYKAQEPQYKKRLAAVGSEKLAGAMKVFDEAFQSISDRLEKIAPRLKYMVRRYVFDAQTRTLDLVEAVDPFLKAVEQIQGPDGRHLKFALLNSDAVKIEQLTATHKLTEQYQAVRDVLDEIYQAGNEVGLQILYRADHFPRKVKDFDGLVKYLQTQDRWTPIQQALDKRQERANGRELTEQEKTQVINTLLRGFSVEGVMLSRPGGAKIRSIETFSNEIEPFYYSLGDGLRLYIHEMMNSIAAREFFGKETVRIRNLRAQKSRLATRLHKIQTRIGYRQPMTEEQYDTHISQAAKEFEAVTRELELLRTQSIEDSVGWYVKDLEISGLLDFEQARDLPKLLNAVFEPKGMARWAHQFTKVPYVVLLSRPSVMITQLEELGFSFIKDSVKAGPEVVRALTGTSKVGLRDIGVREINQYMTDMRLDEWSNKVLFGLQAADAVGKRAYINTALESLREKAKNPTAEFRTYMNNVFGKEDADRVIGELVRGEATPDTKFLAFSELCEIQPMAITETPYYYARGGNWRVMYMLKQFMIKRFGAMRRANLAKMKDPAGNPAMFIEGALGALRWLFILGLFGVGKDALKAAFYGKEFDLSDSVVDNLLNWVLLNRYTAEEASKGRPVETILKDLVPPFGVSIDTLYQDVRSGQLRETVRLVPYVGETYYWWFGYGREKEMKKSRGGRGAAIEP